MIDLLKVAPNCRLPLSKFIPSYHHHFGRQCRVADYGYTKLMDLFEALPHVVQVSTAPHTGVQGCGRELSYFITCPQQVNGQIPHV